jgi:hypothetical protein
MEKINVKEYNRKQKENEKRRDGEKFAVIDSPETKKRVINEHACDNFIFVVKVPYAKYANIVKVSKAVMLRYADEILIPSTVNEGEQKRDEAGKPCYRFNAEFIRGCFAEPEKLDFHGKTWAAWCKEVRTYALRHNAGCAAEAQVCELYGWEQIGEIDRKGHTAHCDAIDADGIRYEIKLETGYIASQFWGTLHEWKLA